MKLNVFQKKKYKALISRLAIALIAVSLGAVLILWDTGIIDLPFIKHNKKKPNTAQGSTQEVLEKEMMDWALFAQDTMDSLAQYSSLKNPTELITTEAFDSDTMSLVKQKLNTGSFSIQSNILIREDKGESTLFATPDLSQIPEGKNYKATIYRDQDGKGIFQKNDTNEYFTLNFETLSFVPSSFDPALNGNKIGISLPSDYAKPDENTQLILEDGLYGYTGSYLDGKRTKSFSIPPSYKTAFPYHEGFAVMADEKGVVTIRNEKGEAVFTNLSLILPEKTGEDLLGFHYFDGGVLRVIIAGYDEEGNLISKRESMINTKGEEISLPDGYYVRNLLGGVLTVTDSSQYGYLSTDGAWIASPIYQSLEPFYGGLAVVTDQNGKMGLMDTKGNLVLPCTFDLITSFSDAHALCYSHSTGWYLLTKVVGNFNVGETPKGSTYYTKITITRGPQNTFDYEPDEIIELPPVVTTVSRTTRPENTLASEKTNTTTKSNNG